MRIRGFGGNNLVSPEGAPVATDKERRPSEARERRGREMVSALETAESRREIRVGMERQRGEAPMEVTPKGLSWNRGE